MWDLIILVPDRCFSFYFKSLSYSLFCLLKLLMSLRCLCDSIDEETLDYQLRVAGSTHRFSGLSDDTLNQGPVAVRPVY